MAKINATIACNLDSNLLLSALPLFAQEKVEAIEWSFDTLYGFSNIPLEKIFIKGLPSAFLLHSLV